MPSKDPRQWLSDIIDNVDAIQNYTKGESLAGYLANRMLRDAVERCLERVTEAARRLGKTMDARYPDVEWPRLRAFGNVLRHEYEGIMDDVIWKMVRKRLTPLRQACQEELERLDAEMSE